MEIEEVSMTEEELREAILEAINSTQTIEEAINQKKEEDKAIKESFDTISKSCTNVQKFNFANILRLRLMKVEAIMLKILCYLIQNGNYDIVCGVIDEIEKTKQDFKDNNQLLKEIKKAILKLKKYGTSACNMEIYELISNIYSREEFVLDDLAEYVDKCRLATRGIQFMGTNKNQEEITKLDSDIDSLVKSLGIRKLAIGDKE